MARAVKTEGKKKGGSKKPARKRESKKKKADEERETGDDTAGGLSLVRSPDFRKEYVTRTLAFPTEFDVRIAVSNEVVGNEEGSFTVVDGMLILTPTAARELHEQLSDVLAAWEEMNGKIPERPSRRRYSYFVAER